MKLTEENFFDVVSVTLQFDVLEGFGDFEGKLRHPDAVDVADLEPIL